MPAGWIYVVLLSALTVLSIRSLAALRGAAPWTSAGWAFTIAYDCTASAEIILRTHAPLHVAYWFLVALAVAFVVAGLRDEPQADPWWWPRRLGPTRSQRSSG